MPSGYGTLSNQVLLGYSHGIAGIADTLLDLFEITGNERLLHVVQESGRYLMAQSMVSLDTENGLTWPKAEGESSPTTAFWCHGAAGIGRFFLHASMCDIFPDADNIAKRAAEMVAHSTRGANPTQCHGLAGNTEFLLDMYQATKDRHYLKMAFTFGELLETFATKQDGYLVFPSEAPTIITPDYMVGYGGIAVCLLRLSKPGSLPHQMSRSGFHRHYDH